MAKLTLTLADGSTQMVEVDSAEEMYDLQNREGKYATGWLQVTNTTWINLAAIVKIRTPTDV